MILPDGTLIMLQPYSERPRLQKTIRSVLRFLTRPANWLMVLPVTTRSSKIIRFLVFTGARRGNIPDSTTVRFEP